MPPCALFNQKRNITNRELRQHAVTTDMKMLLSTGRRRVFPKAFAGEGQRR
jgi:hypothetical protein